MVALHRSGLATEEVMSMCRIVAELADRSYRRLSSAGGGRVDIV